METYEEVLRGELRRADTPDSARLRSALLDSPASHRRDDRAVVPAIVAAFEAGASTGTPDTWDAIRRNLAGREDLAPAEVDRAIAIWSRVRRLDDEGDRVSEDDLRLQTLEIEMQNPEIEPRRPRPLLTGALIITALIFSTCTVLLIGMVAGKFGNEPLSAWIITPIVGGLAGIATVVLARVRSTQA